jgi:hypothetical protein
MGCNHKKVIEILRGIYKRPTRPAQPDRRAIQSYRNAGALKPVSIVKEDTVMIFVCKTCGAIRADNKNEYAYCKGPWSSGYPDNLYHIDK